MSRQRILPLVVDLARCFSPSPPARRAVLAMVGSLAAVSLAAGARAADSAFDPLGGAPDPGPHARVEWILDSPLVPGQVTRTAVHFQIEDGWHTYGNTQNDTGFPARFEPRLPPGIELVDTLWPTPVRHVSPGDILDHVYEDQTAVFLDLSVSPDFTPGEVALGLGVDWLACRDACVFEGDSLSVEWTVSSPMVPVSTSPTSRTAEFAKRLPRPLDPAAGVRLEIPETADDVDGAENPESAVTKPVRIEVQGATGLTFYPDLDGARLTNPIEDGSREGSRLELRIEPGSGELAGILEVRRPGGTDFFRVP